MILLSSNLYREILQFFENTLQSENDVKCLNLARKRFSGLNDLTLISILQQFIIKRAKQNSTFLDKNSKNILEIYEKWRTEKKHGVFLHISKLFKLSPWIVTGPVVAHFVLENKDRTEYSKSQLLRDPSLISDPYLSYEVYLAHIHDLNYSYSWTTINKLVGKEHEILLQNELTRNGLAFKTEETLRAFQYRRTPDIILEIPFAVDGKLVRWIESKATFADEQSHAGYLSSQLKHYLEYGPGMVIYWFGHTAGVKSTKNILVYHKFPDNITHMTF